MVKVMDKVKNELTLTQRTKSIIANFANINPSMWFKAGSELRTIGGNKDVMAIATIEEVLPMQFGIYDLSKFLSIVSTYDNPVIKFQDQQLVIDNNEPYEYRYTAASMILSPPDEDLALEDIIVEVELKEDVLTRLVKRISISGHPEVAFVGKGGNLNLQAVDSSKVNTDTYTSKIADIPEDVSFKIVFKKEKFTVLMPATYKVTLSEAFCLFEADNVKYYISPESE